MTSTTAFDTNCCTDLACEGRKGWVTCDSAPFDANLVADILDARDEAAHKARILARFGADAIADPELANIVRDLENASHEGGVHP